jgi:hypothetical protein
MILLDVAFPDRPYHRPHRPIRQIVEDTVNTVKDSIADVKETVTDSVAQSDIVLNGTGTVDNGEPSIVLAIVVVAAALALCFALAYMYRRRLAV